MALVHNCIIRAMNSIYIQAPLIPSSEYKSFISYSLSVFQGLGAHHGGEEEIFFPELEKWTGEKGIMDTNIAQHEAFHTSLLAWGKWLENVAKTPANFDGHECTTLMDQFIAPLSTHLADEIPSLVSLSRYCAVLDDKLKGMMKAEGDKVMAAMSKTTQLPAFLLNHDITFEGGIHVFPPIPALVSWTLRQCFGRWNASWWKFSAVGFDGQPRELLFVKN